MFWLEISNDTKSIVLGFNTLAQPLINYRLHNFIFITLYCILLTENILKFPRPVQYYGRKFAYHCVSNKP